MRFLHILNRVTLLGIVGSVSLFQARAVLAQQEVNLSYSKFVLSNGLTVLVHEDHKAPVVAINTWYHVGSKNERIGKTGFAHLFEHLMFGGSANASGSYIDAMEKAGATNLNGTTNEDRTNFFETVPVSALDYALFLESDRMGHLEVSQHTLDLQRGVVQNEKRQGLNRPYAVAEQLIAENTYPYGHPYAHTVIGSMEDLNAASLADVQSWLKQYYGPSNATLVLAGDINLGTARKLVQKYYGSIPPGPPVDHEKVWVAKMHGTHTEHAQDRVPQPMVVSTWNVPQFGAADADYLDLVSIILSGAKDSRLYKTLVYDSQIATSVDADNESREIGGQFSISVTAKSEADLAAINAAVQKQLDEFIASGPTPDELEVAKTAYEAGTVRGLDPVIAQSNILANGEVFTHDPEQYKVSLERVRSATTDDLKNAARQWLSDGVYRLEVLPFPEYKASTTDVDRSHIPAIGKMEPLTLPRFERATLSNGLKIIVAERKELPLVNLDMIVNAGYSADHFTEPGTASMTAALLTGGTDKYNALQISAQSEKLGAEISSTARIDNSIVSLSALKSNLDPSLELFADVLLHPTFPESDFARQQKLQLNRIKQEKSQATTVALRILPPLLFGPNSPYGMPFTGSGFESSVAKITREDLVKFHDAWFKPNNATLIVTGDTTLAEIQPKLEALFKSWEPGKVPEKTVPRASAPATPQVYLIDKPGATQSVLIAGTVAPPLNIPNEVALETWNNILGGTFSGRVNMDLRERRHWSYGANTSFFSTRGQRPFIVVAPVQTDKTKESLTALNDDLHGIVGNSPPTQDELKATVDNETQRLAGSRETMQQVTGAVEATVDYGVPDDYYPMYASKALALNTLDLTKAANSFFDPNHMVWVIVGDRSKIEADVRELNLGTLHLVDADGHTVQ